MIWWNSERHESFFRTASCPNSQHVARPDHVVFPKRNSHPPRCGLRTIRAPEPRPAAFPAAPVAQPSWLRVRVASSHVFQEPGFPFAGRDGPRCAVRVLVVDGALRRPLSGASPSSAGQLPPVRSLVVSLSVVSSSWSRCLSALRPLCFAIFHLPSSILAPALPLRPQLSAFSPSPWSRCLPSFRVFRGFHFGDRVKISFENHSRRPIFAHELHEHH